MAPTTGRQYVLPSLPDSTLTGKVHKRRQYRMKLWDPHFHLWDVSPDTVSGHDASQNPVIDGNPVYDRARFESDLAVEGFEFTGGALVEAVSVCHLKVDGPRFARACVAEARWVSSQLAPPPLDYVVVASAPLEDPELPGILSQLGAVCGSARHPADPEPRTLLAPQRAPGKLPGAAGVGTRLRKPGGTLPILRSPVESAPVPQGGPTARAPSRHPDRHQPSRNPDPSGPSRRTRSTGTGSEPLPTWSRPGSRYRCSPTSTGTGIETRWCATRLAGPWISSGWSGACSRRTSRSKNTSAGRPPASTPDSGTSPRTWRRSSSKQLFADNARRAYRASESPG